MIPTCVCMVFPARHLERLRGNLQEPPQRVGQFRARCRRPRTGAASVAHRTAMTAIATDDRQRVTLAFAALVCGAIAMGASVLFVRWADVGPYASAFWRVFLALPFLFAWMRIESRSAAWPLLDRAILLAGLFFTGDLFFWHLAILGTTGANATPLATTAPTWVALRAGLVLSEAATGRALIGLA